MPEKTFTGLLYRQFRSGTDRWALPGELVSLLLRRNGSDCFRSLCHAAAIGHIAVYK